MGEVGLLRDAAYAIAAGETTAARSLLRRLDDRPTDCPAAGWEGQPDVAAAIAALDRDGWRCGYCERLVVHPFMLDLVSRLEPVLLPSGEGPLPAHPALPRLTGVADRLRPLGHEGGSDPANLVAACRCCEGRKRGLTPAEAELADPVRAPMLGWDGLTHLVAPLFEAWQARLAERGEQRPVLSRRQREWLRLARGVRLVA